MQVYTQKSTNSISVEISLAMPCFLNGKQILSTEPRFEKSSNSPFDYSSYRKSNYWAVILDSSVSCLKIIAISSVLRRISDDKINTQVQLCSGTEMSAPVSSELSSERECHFQNECFNVTNAAQTDGWLQCLPRKPTLAQRCSEVPMWRLRQPYKSRNPWARKLSLIGAQNWAYQWFSARVGTALSSDSFWKCLRWLGVIPMYATGI